MLRVRDRVGRYESRRGFTIIELLIVVVVIAILAAITIVTYTGIQKRAQTSAYASKVDGAEKIVRMMLAENKLFGDSPSVIWTCLGTMADFPAKDGFNEGECMYLKNAAADRMSYAQVREGDMGQLVAFNPGMRLGAFPVTSVIMGVDGTLFARGVSFMAFPGSPTSLLRWIPPDTSSCGRGLSYAQQMQEMLIAARAVVNGTMTVAVFNAEYDESLTFVQIRDEYLPALEAIASTGGELCDLVIQ